MPRKPGRESLPVGSQLELTGVYSGQGGNRAVGQDISSFELLLNSPADIPVLARPPWWTLERLLIIVGALACVLAVTVLWITQLHRQVEATHRRTGSPDQERQRVEHQRAMEQERARIAQDLHDELGSGITEISMLGTRAESAAAPTKSEAYLEQMGDKAREMVTALDEIVWAMNPAPRFAGVAGQLFLPLRGPFSGPGEHRLAARRPAGAGGLRGGFPASAPVVSGFQGGAHQCRPPFRRHGSPPGHQLEARRGAAVHRRQRTRAAGRCAHRGNGRRGQHAGAPGKTGRPLRNGQRSRAAAPPCAFPCRCAEPKETL